MEYWFSLQKKCSRFRFCNHATFDKASTTFTADGKNYANDKWITKYASYDNSVASKTPLLNAGSDTALNEVNQSMGHVVDKQVTRQHDGMWMLPATQKAGDWDLKSINCWTIETTSGQEIDGA